VLEQHTQNHFDSFRFALKPERFRKRPHGNEALAEYPTARKSNGFNTQVQPSPDKKNHLPALESWMDGISP
jgi:hypothetical protein